jgi:hypothetical protein
MMSVTDSHPAFLRHFDLKRACVLPNAVESLREFWLAMSTMVAPFGWSILQWGDVEDSCAPGNHHDVDSDSIHSFSSGDVPATYVHCLTRSYALEDEAFIGMLKSTFNDVADSKGDADARDVYRVCCSLTCCQC